MKFLAIFASAGLIVPVVDSLLFIFALDFLHKHWVLYTKWTYIRILVWPSSLMFFGTPSKPFPYGVAISSTLINVLLYSMIGITVWMGMKKGYWILYLVITTIVLLWFYLWKAFQPH
jgi:hypothetical protein